MASLNSVYIKLDTLKQITHTLEVKGEKGVELTIAVNDEVNNYNQNVSAFVAQTKEQREAKTNKFYVGNGRTVWTDGKITAFEYKKDTAETKKAETDNNGDGPDLPF